MMLLHTSLSTRFRNDEVSSLPPTVSLVIRLEQSRRPPQSECWLITYVVNTSYAKGGLRRRVMKEYSERAVAMVTSASPAVLQRDVSLRAQQDYSSQVNRLECSSSVCVIYKFVRFR